MVMMNMSVNYVLFTVLHGPCMFHTVSVITIELVQNKHEVPHTAELKDFELTIYVILSIHVTVPVLCVVQFHC